MNDTDDNEEQQPRTNQLARRTFGGMELASEGPQTQALIAASVADIQARWMVAMRRPRNMDDVRQDILAECRRPAFADVATYSRPVGKKFNETTGQWEEQFAEGLSIRFAEVALRYMGNMSCDTVTIFDSDRERMVRVTACDYESNGKWSRDITVKKTIERKKLKKGQQPLGTRVNSLGDTVYIVEASDSEVAVKEAAEISKASRTAILRLVPGNIQDEAFEVARRVMSDKTAKDPDAARTKMLDAFASVSLSRDDLEEYLGTPIAKASPAQIETLRKIFGAIRDGETTWAEVIAKPETAKPTPKVPLASVPATAAKPEPAPFPPEVTEAKAIARATDAALVNVQTPAPGPSSKGGVGELKKAIATDAPKTSAASSFAKAKDKVREKETVRESPLVVEPGDPEPIEVPCKVCGVPVDCEPGVDPSTVQCYACANA